MKKIYETTYFGRKLRVEIGEVALQTKAGALVYYGDTCVLSVVVSKETLLNQDFFPLMVLYQEKLYAAGKIPGGFLKRESRPTEQETLASRLIDRPIRPLFDQGFNDEVQVINTVLSNDPDCSSVMAALFGSSLVLSLSDIPFLGPIAGAIVGYKDGVYIGNPTNAELGDSKINLTVAGTKDAINMVEAGAKQASEKEMLDAIAYGHAEIKKLCQFQNKIVKEIGVAKVPSKLFTISKELTTKLTKKCQAKLVKAVSIKEKLERYQAIDLIINKELELAKEVPFLKKVGEVEVFDYQEQENYLKQVKAVLDHIVTKEVRRLITVDKIRPDGRGVDEIRPLSSRVGLLPRVHGSALFTRGQTQSLGTVTLGSLKENQIIDGLTLEDSKRFMLHYNFPQYSVGETGRYGSPGRREIGHGALGERALAQVIPNEEEFPYTIRIVSEILESNGSSSQATICSGCLALMDAGVPIKAPVAGIAMGLIKEGEHYTILTDIQGMEDHEGDMDFKVAGTFDGIVALQMDIKIDGITPQILEEALNQAKKGRIEILNHMLTTLAKSREEMSPWAPKVKMIKIKPEKIKEVIGSGGKVINAIIDAHPGVKIDIEQDGRVYVMHMDKNVLEETIKAIEEIIKEAQIGAVYEGKVMRIEAYGAFVELWNGCEGLLHISKISEQRVEKVTDVLNLGDQVIVKVIGIDDKGRIDLSRKDAFTEGIPVQEKRESKPRDYQKRNDHNSSRNKDFKNKPRNN
jgi:polyribonucleotide nucleotidyltransferase